MFKDFYLDINLNKIYLTLTKELRVIEYAFSVVKWEKVQCKKNKKKWIKK
jgi:hypothetical protein